MVQQSHFWIYIEKNEKQSRKEIFAQIHVHSTIHNSDEVEASQMSTEG